MLQRVLGGLAALLGLTVMLGWLLHVPAMVEFIPGSVPMVFDTALCFALAGGGLCAYSVAGLSAKTMQTWAGALLLLLGGACLVEHVLDVSVGVDFAGLHTWYDYGNTRPGRMAPNTAFGFMVIGAALMVVCRVTSRPRALLALGLTYGLLAIGLTGLGGYFLGPDLLFGWSRSARMALHTSLGMICCAGALRSGWNQADWYQSQAYLGEQQKIAFSGIAVLLVAMLTAGLGGFVVQQQVSQAALRQSLPLMRDARAALFEGMIRDAIANSRQAGSDRELTRAALATLKQPGSDEFAALSRDMTSASSGVFRSIALLDGSRHVVSSAGAQPVKAEMIADLSEAMPASLIWTQGVFLVRTEAPLVVERQEVGSLVLEQELPYFQAQVLGVEDSAASLEIALCKSERIAVECFPTARRAGLFAVPATGQDGKPLPAALGLAGRTGMVDALDQRGIRIAAAFAPLQSGLVMVVQQDTAQLYGDIRQALNTSVLLILVIAACGAALLHMQLTPLTERLLQSEARLAELARVDTLTGLPNRYALSERMMAAIHRRRRVGKGVVVMFLDVDRFKTLNDTLGHAAGDAVLKEFAARLKRGVRVTDTVARLAGDEFVIVAEGLTAMREAEVIANSILEKVRAPWLIAGKELKVTTSIGMAYFEEDEVDPEQMLAKADAALYGAKAKGRDGFSWGADAGQSG